MIVWVNTLWSIKIQWRPLIESWVMLGEVTFLLAGNFRQTLAVTIHGIRADKRIAPQESNCEMVQVKLLNNKVIIQKVT